MYKTMKATHYIYVLFAALFTLVCAGCEATMKHVEAEKG